MKGKYLIFLFLGGCWLYLFIKGIIIPSRTKNLPGRTSLLKTTIGVLFFIALLTILEFINFLRQSREYPIVFSLWLQWGWYCVFAYYLFTLHGWLEQIKWKIRNYKAEEKSFNLYLKNRRLINFNTILLVIFGSIIPIQNTILFRNLDNSCGLWEKIITNIPIIFSAVVPVSIFLITLFAISKSSRLNNSTKKDVDIYR